MTLSRRDRESNAEIALRAMLDQLGDQCICDQGGVFDVADARFAEVLPTTWRALLDAGLIERDDTIGPSKRYLFTGYGWYAALVRLGLNAEPEFQARLGKVASALKDLVKEREDDVVESFNGLRCTADVPEGFLHNVIESGALRRQFGIVDATWRDRRCAYIDVPVNFGHKLD